MRKPKHLFPNILVIFALITPNCQQQQVEKPEDWSNNNRYPDRSSRYTSQYDFDSLRNVGAGQFRGGEQQLQPQTPASFAYDPYPTNNNSRSNIIVTRKTTVATTTTTTASTARPGAKPNRSPFDDPNRYRVPQTRQESDQVRYVNGRPYK